LAIACASRTTDQSLHEEAAADVADQCGAFPPPAPAPALTGGGDDDGNEDHYVPVPIPRNDEPPQEPVLPSVLVLLTLTITRV
jgi:hypothetical protein